MRSSIFTRPSSSALPAPDSSSSLRRSQKIARSPPPKVSVRESASPQRRSDAALMFWLTRSSISSGLAPASSRISAQRWLSAVVELKRKLPLSVESAV